MVPLIRIDCSVGVRNLNAQNHDMKLYWNTTDKSVVLLGFGKMRQDNMTRIHHRLLRGRRSSRYAQPTPDAVARHRTAIIDLENGVRNVYKKIISTLNEGRSCSPLEITFLHSSRIAWLSVYFRRQADKESQSAAKQRLNFEVDPGIHVA